MMTTSMTTVPNHTLTFFLDRFACVFLYIFPVLPSLLSIFFHFLLHTSLRLYLFLLSQFHGC